MGVVALHLLASRHRIGKDGLLDEGLHRSKLSSVSSSGRRSGKAGSEQCQSIDGLTGITSDRDPAFRTRFAVERLRGSHGSATILKLLSGSMRAAL